MRRDEGHLTPPPFPLLARPRVSLSLSSPTLREFESIQTLFVRRDEGHLTPPFSPSPPPLVCWVTNALQRQQRVGEVHYGASERCSGNPLAGPHRWAPLCSSLAALPAFARLACR